MGHSTVSCAKTAEPIEMPFWMKIWVGQRNHVLDGVADSPREGTIFGGCPGHSKALSIFAAVVAAAFAVEGIIQSPITSCSKIDHSVCQASANSILKIFVRMRFGRWTAKRVV